MSASALFRCSEFSLGVRKPRSSVAIRSHSVSGAVATHIICAGRWFRFYSSFGIRLWLAHGARCFAAHLRQLCWWCILTALFVGRISILFLARFALFCVFIGFRLSGAELRWPRILSPFFSYFYSMYSPSVFLSVFTMCFVCSSSCCSSFSFISHSADAFVPKPSRRTVKNE